MAKTDPTDLTSLLRERQQHRTSSRINNYSSTEENAQEKTVQKELPEKQEVQTNRQANRQEIVARHSPAPPPSPSSPKPSDSSPKKVGRPPGRRSNPNVNPLNLLIEEDLVNEVRYKLGKLNKGKSPKEKASLSDLVEGLLKEWLDEQP